MNQEMLNFNLDIFQIQAYRTNFSTKIILSNFFNVNLNLNGQVL